MGVRGEGIQQIGTVKCILYAALLPARAREPACAGPLPASKWAGQESAGHQPWELAARLCVQQQMQQGVAALLLHPLPTLPNTPTPPTTPPPTHPPPPPPTHPTPPHTTRADLRGDDVLLLVPVEPRHALDGQVVGLCGAAGEDDLLCVCPDHSRHLQAPCVCVRVCAHVWCVCVCACVMWVAGQCAHGVCALCTGPFRGASRSSRCPRCLKALRQPPSLAARECCSKKGAPARGPPPPPPLLPSHTGGCASGGCHTALS